MRAIVLAVLGDAVHRLVVAEPSAQEDLEDILDAQLLRNGWSQRVRRLSVRESSTFPRKGRAEPSGKREGA